MSPGGRQASCRPRTSGCGARAHAGLAPFAEVYGHSGTMITAVDLLRGLAALVGWKRIEVPGATGYLDTDYAAKGRYAIEAIPTTDIICVHVEATDEASHEGRAADKIKALEEIDRHIVGPLHAALRAQGEYRILVSPDHPTPLRTKTHSHGAVPWRSPAADVTPDGSEDVQRDHGRQSRSLSFDPGWKLMRYFLRGEIEGHTCPSKDTGDEPPVASHVSIRNGVIYRPCGTLRNPITSLRPTQRDIMPLIVQKFGGTSVADSQKILAAARKAIRAQADGNQVVMVVSAMGHNTDVAGRSGPRDHGPSAGPRDGHAAFDRRAGERGADGDGHRIAGLPGDQLDRRPDRHSHRQHAHQGADSFDLDRSHARGAGRRQDRHRRRLPGDRRGLQHHHARPRRQRYHGRGPGGGAGGRRVRDLHRRRRRLHDRPAACCPRRGACGRSATTRCSSWPAWGPA